MANDAATLKSARFLENNKHILDALLRSLLSKDAITQEELNSIFDITIRKVCETLHAQAVMVLMLDLSGQKIHYENVYFSPTLYGKDEGSRRRVLDKLRELSKLTGLRNRQCEAWKAIGGGQSVTASPSGAYRDFCKQANEATGLAVASIIAAPIVVNGATVGCIEAINKGSNGSSGAFEAGDLIVLEDVAVFAGKALRRLLDPGSELSDHETAECIARLSKFEAMQIDKEWQPDRKLLQAIGEEKLRRYQVMPLANLGENRLRVALSNPLDIHSIGDFEIVTGMKVAEKVIASPQDIREALDRAFPKATAVHAAAESVQKVFQGLGAHADVMLGEEDNELSAPIVQLANRIVEDAYQMGASDIHIEPQEDTLLVRYRIDGVCRVKLALPILAHPPLVSRYKIMSEMNISEHRLPQDGRLVFKRFSPNFDLDLRVSVMPTNHGENVVMRILDKKRSTLPLDKLGFSEYNLKNYRRIIQAPYGMILHCGPTGSGKSMTLYAALNEINSPEWKILTAEEPIEYTLPQINQIQVRRDIGLTFASCLRSFLRQDPDIILVGEIRDRETAEIAVEASLTGHLLFSTLHTNDAPSTITRLVEIGIERFLISSTLVSICAQRLVRRLCKCRVEGDPTEEERELLARAKDGKPIGKIGRTTGCGICDRTGFKGRTGIHELLECKDELRGLITRGASTEEIKRAARRNGMRTLFEDAMDKAKAGITSMPEALGIAQPDEEAEVR